MTNWFKQITQVRHPYESDIDKQRSQALINIAAVTVIALFIATLLQYASVATNPLFVLFGRGIGAGQTSFPIMVIMAFSTLILMHYQINHGKIQAATLSYVVFLILVSIVVSITNPLNSFVIIVFSLPLCAAGVLLTRRDLAVVVGIICIFVALFLVLHDLDAFEMILGSPTGVEEQILYTLLILIVDAAMLRMFSADQRILLQQNETLNHNLQTTLQEKEEMQHEIAVQHMQQTALQKAMILSQEEVLEAQKASIRELSTPILPLFNGVIILPLVGKIDNQRALEIMRALLAAISEHRAKILILDVTGVHSIDTGVAQYLTQSIQAARLKGARTIMTGISNAVAETMIDLGVDWHTIKTVSDLQSGLLLALEELDAIQQASTAPENKKS